MLVCPEKRKAQKSTPSGDDEVIFLAVTNHYDAALLFQKFFSSINWNLL